MTAPAQHWRDLIKVHPAADLFPMMTETELQELARDIRANEMRVAPVFWTPMRRADMPGPRSKKYLNVETYLLDGRNRIEALWRTFDEADEDGSPEDDLRYLMSSAFKSYDKTAVMLYGDDDPWSFVVSANLRRRHLDRDQKREIVAALLKARPDRSDRETARLAKVSHPTVAIVRAELEASGDVENLSTRTDAVGRQQPASKPPAAPRASRPVTSSKESQIRALREATAGHSASALTNAPPAPQPEPQEPRAAAHAPADPVSAKTRARYFNAAELFDVAKSVQANPDVADSWPLQKRIALARGCLAALKITLDDLRDA